MDYGNHDASDEEIVAMLTAILGKVDSVSDRVKSWLWVSTDYQAESGEITQGYSVSYDDSSMLSIVIVPNYPINPTLLAVIGAAEWYGLHFNYLEVPD